MSHEEGLKWLVLHAWWPGDGSGEIRLRDLRNGLNRNIRNLGRYKGGMETNESPRRKIKTEKIVF